MPPVEWQRALRRQFGREQAFVLENRGAEPFFSDFLVGNPQSKSRYRVAIRGLQPGDNFCACPDYATNELGTCKHIEFALAKLHKRRGAKAAFARGWKPPFSDILDGGLGEIALGGSRLNRFMEEVENVTGGIVEGDAMAPAEEGEAAAAVPADALAAEPPVEEEADDGPAAASPPDPWTALLQVGTQLFSSLLARDASSGAPRPWIEHNAATGERRLRVPLPPPETARQLAEALSGMADLLRGGGARTP